MLDVERDILIILYDYDHFAIKCMCKACFIQYVRVTTCQIADHEGALRDRRKYVIND